MISIENENLDVLEVFPMKLRDRRVYQSGSMTYLMIAIIIGMLVTTIVQADTDNDAVGLNYLPSSVYKDFLKYNMATRSLDESPSRRNTWLSPYSFDSSITDGIYSLRISTNADGRNQLDASTLGNTSLIFGMGYNKEYSSNGYGNSDEGDAMLFGLSRDQYKLQGPLFFMSVDHRW
jgi:hypothetical protein